MAFFSKLIGAGRSSALSAQQLSPLGWQAAVAVSVAAQQAAHLLRAPTALMQLSKQEALSVVGYMRPRLFARGTEIIRQGETADTGFMVLVLEGEITVENLFASRATATTLKVLGPGSLIGEMSLVDGAARSASCIAITEVQCAVLTREALEALITKQPATAAKLMTAVAQCLAERLRESSQKLQVTNMLMATLQQEVDRLVPTPLDKHPG